MSEVIYGNKQNGRVVPVVMRTPREKSLDPLASPRPELAALESGREIRPKMSARPMLSGLDRAPRLHPVEPRLERPGLSRG